MPTLELHPERLFQSNGPARDIALQLYERVADMAIISPHGHTDPAWFGENEPFQDATSLLLIPDHYLFRMLHSQGIALSDLGVPRADGAATATDRRRIWRLFAEHYHLFRGTPSRLWLDHVFVDVFGMTERLDAATADDYYESIMAQLQTDECRPRALLDRFNIEVIATTEGAVDELPHHGKLRGTKWQSRVITTFRPDDVVDPEREDFAANVATLAELTNEDTATWPGYLAALRKRREFFKSMGATATDHGHPTATTVDLSAKECEAVFARCLAGGADAGSAETFRGQMLTEMAKMSIDDGLVMQIHPGSWRNHDPRIFSQHGRDKGADIPMRTRYVDALKPLLDLVGNEPDLNIILFTLDETTYSRELAPLAGHYPVLILGPPWWFHDSPEGMLRFRRRVTETGGFYNTAGFNDDTRALLSIPARHDVARRIDCRFLADLVTEHRIELDEAEQVVVDLAYGLAQRAYKLDRRGD